MENKNYHKLSSYEELVEYLNIRSDKGKIREESVDEIKERMDDIINIVADKICKINCIWDLRKLGEVIKKVTAVDDSDNKTLKNCANVFDEHIISFLDNDQSSKEILLLRAKFLSKVALHSATIKAIELKIKELSE
jgi:hypothetical protein